MINSNIFKENLKCTSYVGYTYAIGIIENNYDMDINWFLD